MEQLNLFGIEKRLVSIDPVRNRFRFYFLGLYRFNAETVVLEKRWGRIGFDKKKNNYAPKFIRREIVSNFLNVEDALAMFNGKLKEKISRKYALRGVGS